jgi:hypothetical protein
VQGAAVCRLPQLPFTHLMFGAQSLSEAHCVRQAAVVGSHPNGEQILAGPVAQLPAPSQRRTPCKEAPLHAPAWQIVPAG